MDSHERVRRGQPSERRAPGGIAAAGSRSFDLSADGAQGSSDLAARRGLWASQAPAPSPRAHDYTAEELDEDVSALRRRGVTVRNPDGFVAVVGRRVLFSEFERAYRDAVALWRELHPGAPEVEANLLEVACDRNVASWQIEIAVQGVNRGCLKRELRSEVVAHTLFTLDAELQAQGLRAFLFQAQDNLYVRLGVKEVRVSASPTVGKYAWARDYFDAGNDQLERSREAFHTFMDEHAATFAAAGVSAEQQQAVRGLIDSAQHMWELAAITFPPSAGGSATEDGKLDVKDREPWGLEPEHKLGRYALAKLFFLGTHDAWDGSKSYAQGADGAQLRLAAASYLATAVRAANEVRRAQGAAPLCSVEIERLARRMRSL